MPTDEQVKPCFICGMHVIRSLDALKTHKPGIKHEYLFRFKCYNCKAQIEFVESSWDRAVLIWNNVSAAAKV